MHMPCSLVGFEAKQWLPSVRAQELRALDGTLRGRMSPVIFVHNSAGVLPFISGSWSLFCFEFIASQLLFASCMWRTGGETRDGYQTY